MPPRPIARVQEAIARTRKKGTLEALQNRHGGRGDQRGPGPGDAPARDQKRRALREGAGGGTRGEEAEAREQGALLAVAVAEGAGRDEEGGEDDDVRVDGPQDLGGRGVQRGRTQLRDQQVDGGDHALGDEDAGAQGEEGGAFQGVRGHGSSGERGVGVDALSP
ncbi:predicted protein [Streptomyces sviceus ATCC 29083]|uniref:Uncharacterized protein n=1 Tax=Streptomyces sviceus (strain ATCC 29083 / DSM 924 / JCM 4929 / NBRC 13980 / NCIMB 11184 / NRRL 5439 / UC 5370) TaxID=463191 RepID=B5HVE0_STRX2|nr:predicted protein [Streptomyces sviceus ATCC 29083]